MTAEDRVEAAADELYGVPPEDFVPVRDGLVTAAKEAADRDAARTIGRLRRPTQAAWLANLLARERGEQLDGLLDLAGELSAAQRTLDGPQLRALSAQRSKLVGAMAREARRLAAADGHRVTESVERDLRGILDAALADAGIAEEVRSGRLTRTVSWSGFGPDDGESSTPGRRPGSATPGRRPSPGPERPSRDRAEGSAGEAGRWLPGSGSVSAPGREPEPERESDADRARREQEEHERRRARAEAAQAVADALAEAGRAADAHEEAVAALRDAEADRDEATARVDQLTAELDRARGTRAQAADAAKEAARAEREAGRTARDAAAALDRAEAVSAEPP